MSTDFQIYPLDAASKVFPPQNDSINELFQEKSAKLGEIDARSPQTFQIGLAIGIIIMLGSVFAILAAHQVLPTGINAFNQLHAGSYVIGYGLLAAGFIVTLLNAVKWRNFGSEIASIRQETSENFGGQEYHIKTKAIQEKLAEDEVLAISAELWGSTRVHILTKQDDYWHSNIDGPIGEAFYTKTPTLESRTYGELLAGKHFVTLENLPQRV